MMREEKKYIYLLKQGKRFKIGFSQNPKKRFKSYKTHNSDFQVQGIFEVPDKLYEKITHLELLKMGYRRCIDLHEWFEGEIENIDIQRIVDKFLNQNLS